LGKWFKKEETVSQKKGGGNTWGPESLLVKRFLLSDNLGRSRGMVMKKGLKKKGKRDAAARRFRNGRFSRKFA